MHIRENECKSILKSVKLGTVQYVKSRSFNDQVGLDSSSAKNKK